MAAAPATQRFYPYCDLKKRKRKLGVHVIIYSYMNQDYNGFTRFKINVLKQHFLILFLAALHLSLSHSDQLSSNNEHFQLYTYFHIAMRSVKHGHVCSCRTVLKL